MDKTGANKRIREYLVELNDWVHIEHLDFKNGLWYACVHHEKICVGIVVLHDTGEIDEFLSDSPAEMFERVLAYVQ